MNDKNFFAYPVSERENPMNRFDETMRKIREVQEIMLVTFTEGEPQEEELIHDLRINFRRLLALLSFYAPLLRKKWRRETEDLLKKLLRSLGLSRELQMLEKAWEKYQGSLTKDTTRKEVPEAFSEALGSFIAVDQEKKGEPQEDLLSIWWEVCWRLDAPSDILWRKKRVKAASESSDFERQRMRSLQMKLQQKEASVDPKDSRAVHQLRIAGKGAMYAAELLGGSWDDEFIDWLRHLQKLHDLIGKIHDGEVNLGLLQEVEKIRGKTGALEGFRQYLIQEERRGQEILEDLLIRD
ncbi:CHAD domain-containing protein [Proteiniclasticum sp. BAD-10]|uniref:CHAD domain-containing protein n=1 Tax=Proteiniclasticum sediminis TaxID=2804028 RepID=A0A941CMJ5_9CLOT|nr:CHAD domain-containing protein [Proteiniclasticum sediminis]MBR0575435.1 CHAD domain-containing protein [Proteiniclasticum sediminis]